MRILNFKKFKLLIESENDENRKLEIVSKLTLMFGKNVGIDFMFGSNVNNKDFDLWELTNQYILFEDFIGKSLYKHLSNQISKGIQWRGVIDFLEYYKNNQSSTSISKLVLILTKDLYTGGIFTYDENKYPTLEDAISDKQFILIYGGGYSRNLNKIINQGNLSNLQS